MLFTAFIGEGFKPGEWGYSLIWPIRGCDAGQGMVIGLSVLNRGYKILRESVLNIVYDFVRVSPKYKQEEICLYPKHTKAITIT